MVTPFPNHPQGIDVFVRKFEIMMGRISKNAPIDVVLGDSNSISRQHAKIVYSFEHGAFELVVMSKNGAHGAIPASWGEGLRTLWLRAHGAIGRGRAEVS